jgi:hypothetical protein
MLLFENESSLFPVRNDILFRLIGAIVQPPCDQQSLLRLGQTIAATLPSSSGGEWQESDFPFHIAELERLLLQSHEGELNRHHYAVYVRNRLVNIISTTLAHSSGQVNSQLSELLVNTLGFGWLLSLCEPGIHPGTLLLALRTMVGVLRHPALMEKFRFVLQSLLEWLSFS